MKYTKQVLENWDVKKKVISLLYDKLNLHGFRYTIISEQNHVDTLQKNQHYILMNYISRNYLLMFFFIDGSKRCFLIDRKTLAYQPKNLDDVVRVADIQSIEPFQALKTDVFKGTILDVKLVKNVFHVYNVFMWKGYDRTTDPTLENFALVNNERIEMIAPIKEYYYSDLPQLKQTLEEDTKINGFIFIPKIPGNQMIFLNKPKAKIDVKEPVKEYPIFYMEKQDKPDVYFLFETDKKNTSPICAYIPNIECSKKCMTWMQGKRTVKVRCIYNEILDLYVPNELVI